CSAPCVGITSQEAYAKQVAQAKLFLRGKSRQVQQEFAHLMEQASQGMQYELAGQYRDKIRALTRVQSQQSIQMEGSENCDIISMARSGRHTCIQVFFIRAGINHGNRNYFPRHDANARAQDIMSAFLGQFYATRPTEGEILVSHTPRQLALLQDALNASQARKTKISCPQRGIKRKIMDQALANAEKSLQRHLQKDSDRRNNLQALAALLDMDEEPARIEIYDNSHLQGDKMLGGMVVMTDQGFTKNQYRRFNQKTPQNQTAGDDYAMMREVMHRRFAKATPDDETWPDLLIIDGGRGHLRCVREVLEELGLYEDLTVIGVSKGPDRNAGREKIHIQGRAAISLPEDSELLFFIQQMRDEAHRFAIGALRKRRRKAMIGSSLDEIPNIGAHRKRILLRHFGSARAVAGAGLDDLQILPGISRQLAKQIYDFYHS
ncbi:MAG: excinuclease ABC subunit UvrC, partial [Pseudomonadota bacterium]